MTDYKEVTLKKLVEVLKKKNITQLELSTKTGIDQGNLSAILKGSKSLGDKTLIKIANAIGVSFDYFKNSSYINEGNGTENYVGERENTYQADTVEIPDFVGENPQSLFLEKLKYLSKIGEMRNSGLLEEEEFLKIKNRLINLL